VVLTSNAKTDGIYLPPDDRRFYVAWSDEPGAGEDGCLGKAYFDDLWTWLFGGGFGHVAAWLRARDLRKFNPKAPPVRTKAWRDIVAANRTAQDTELSDVLDAMGRPEVVTVEDIRRQATHELSEWLKQHGRIIQRKMEQEGYERVENPTAKDGVWKFGKERVRIYGRKELGLGRQIQGAEKLKKEREAEKDPKNIF
jgi:hypothetical protein